MQTRLTRWFRGLRHLSSTLMIWGQSQAHMMGGENWLPEVVLWHVHTHTHRERNKYNFKKEMQNNTSISPLLFNLSKKLESNVDDPSHVPPTCSYPFKHVKSHWAAIPPSALCFSTQCSGYATTATTDWRPVPCMLLSGTARLSLLFHLYWGHLYIHVADSTHQGCLTLHFTQGKTGTLGFPLNRHFRQ